MTKKAYAQSLLILFLVSVSVVESSPFHSPQRGNRQVGASETRFEFFSGVGYFQPSLKGWNNQVENFNTQLLQNGAAGLHNFLIVRNNEYVPLDDGYWNLGPYSAESGQKYLEGDLMYNIGMRYYLTNHLNLSISVSSFSTDANSRFSITNSSKEEFWPNYGYDVVDQITVAQKLKIYPTVLALNFNLPLGQGGNNFEIYGGAGVGFNFSQLKTEIMDKYGLTLTRGEALWDSLSFSENPLNMNIISNIQANANPFCMQASVGANLRFGMVLINLEVGYNFAKAKFNENDWRFYSRKFSPIVQIEGKQAPDYEVKYTEERKYYFEIPESAYESLKVNEIDYSGVIFKGSIGLTF